MTDHEEPATENDQKTEQQVDHTRRKFLARATTTMGALGVAATCAPFASSLMPSRDTIAAGQPIKVDISQMQPGEQKTVKWRGKPIWIIRRTEEDLKTLKNLKNRLRDPRSQIDQQPPYAANIHRSIKPEWLVLVGICTHLGCVPTYRPEEGSISKSWPGGFFCSCHGSKFDMAGRVFKNVPAPKNLVVPPYTFLDADTLLIGSHNPKEA